MRDKVDILAGFTLTPEALGAAGVATEAKKFMVDMNAATSIVTEKSPYIVRVRSRCRNSDPSAPGSPPKARSRRPIRW